jgi:hypothetical protein
MKSSRLLPWMVALNKPLPSCLLVAVMLQLTCGLAQAQELEGTWKLVMRKFQDGTTQTPPAIQGAATWHNGLRHAIVDGHTPEGKLWSFSIISNYKLSATEWTETVLLSVFDHGNGKLPDYNVTGASKTSPVTHEGPRISFKPASEPVSYAFEGDKWTVTSEGVFVDYFERVR